MIDASKGILVSGAADAVHVRVVGRGTFQNSQPLRRYVLEKVEGGCRNVIVDLARCDGMDSTFLGVLAGIGLRLQQNLDGGKIRIANLNGRNLELLRTLGLDRLVSAELCLTVADRPPSPPDDEFQKLPETDLETATRPLDKIETARVMLSAHEDLIRADERNAARFQNVTAVLRDQAKTRKEGGNER